MGRQPGLVHPGRRRRSSPPGPSLYGASFSGFYLAMFLVLMALILRPVGFKYRSKRAGKAWRRNWDWALFAGGFIPALVFGVRHRPCLRPPAERDCRRHCRDADGGMDDGERATRGRGRGRGIRGSVDGHAPAACGGRGSAFSGDRAGHRRPRPARAVPRRLHLRRRRLSSRLSGHRRGPARHADDDALDGAQLRADARPHLAHAAGAASARHRHLRRRAAQPDAAPRRGRLRPDRADGAGDAGGARARRPYFAQSLHGWEQGRFIRFHGAAQWVGWLWPYAAIVYLLTRLAGTGRDSS